MDGGSFNPRERRASASGTVRGTALSYGQAPAAEQIKALVGMGLTDAEIGERYQRSRSWAKWLRGRYGIRGQPSGIGRHRRAEKAGGRTGAAAILRQSAPVPTAPRRPPSLEGLDDECRRWLERGGRITRFEAPPASDSGVPVRPRSRGF